VVAGIRHLEADPPPRSVSCLEAEKLDYFSDIGSNPTNSIFLFFFTRFFFSHQYDLQGKT